MVPLKFRSRGRYKGRENRTDLPEGRDFSFVRERLTDLSCSSSTEDFLCLVPLNETLYVGGRVLGRFYGRDRQTRRKRQSGTTVSFSLGGRDPVPLDVGGGTRL